MRTSETHPIRVDWLPTPWIGRVGLTFAPGKKQPESVTGGWDRDLATDLAELRRVYGTHWLVCLLEDHELEELQITQLMSFADAAGIRVVRVPIADGDVPRDDHDVAKLVSDIAGWAATGQNVVVHCRGGLGRAGTIGACVLIAAGLEPPRAIEAVRTERGAGAIETRDQERYVLRFRQATQD